MRIRAQYVFYCFVSLTLLVGLCFCGTAFETPLVEFQGNVVDDETGTPITDFVVQLGKADPQEPQGITWSQEFHGPVHQRVGFFSLQSIKQGKTWARVLANGYLPQPATTEPVISPIRVENLVVRLKRGGELRGIVVDYDSKPVFGARVFLVGAQRLDLTDGKPDWVFKGSTAITDSKGIFALRGVGGIEQKVIVSADGLQAWLTPKPELGQELKITLPQPAVLIVRYDIPGDTPNAELWLQSKTWESVHVKEVTSIQKPILTNQSQTVLTNLTPGTYDLMRSRMLRVGIEAHGVFSDRSTVVLQAGQTQRVDLVRATGFPISGEVVGLKGVDAPGAFVYVRSAEATGDPRKIEEWRLPLFDAVTCDEAGHFSTARLEPGTYTLVVEAFVPRSPSHTINTGIRLPDYIGTAKVTIGAHAPPVPVKIELTLRSLP